MELKRDDIIKALECCSSEITSEFNCDACPYRSKGCNASLLRDALSLIKELAEECASLNDENERLRASTIDYRNIPNIVADARADTVRKMQERLEELYTDKLITDDMTVSIGVIKQNIKDIAKEMLEGEK